MDKARDRWGEKINSYGFRLENRLGWDGLWDAGLVRRVFSKRAVKMSVRGKWFSVKVKR
jgi:hypothetical protein